MAPWRSSCKINLQVGSEVTYLLTSGGHNAGIVSEPRHPGRSFRVNTRSQRYLDPDLFLTQATPEDGSWWPEWIAWLKRSSGLAAPAPIGRQRQGFGRLPTRRALTCSCNKVDQSNRSAGVAAPAVAHENDGRIDSSGRPFECLLSAR